jgi:glyoxalase family protein
MEKQVLGLHHITAIANSAQANYDFYTKILGQRLVKKTVNFDDPGTYHFYYGDEIGRPGTLLTFFPWAGIGKGRNGIGMATGIGYSVPPASLEFWSKRLRQFGVKQQPLAERFGESYLPFEDPDGLQLELIVPERDDQRKAWESPDIKGAAAIKGLHSVTLRLNNKKATAEVLTDILGYHLSGQESNRYRFVTDAVENAAIVELLEIPGGQPGRNLAGTNHHVAFRVKYEEKLKQYREKIVAAGFNVTPKINRDYFFSLYFREPGGVLFELATENPGFTTDESVSELGSGLKLPGQYEPARTQIERALPSIK